MRQFRKARMEDLDEIMTVIDEARAFIASIGIDQWQDGYPQRDVIEADLRQGIGYVLYDGGIGAYAAMMLTEEPCYRNIDGAWLTQEGEYATMHRTAVCNRIRHSGAATEILRNLERLALLNAKRSMRVDTHRGNVAMNAFLQKQGYARCGEVDYSSHVAPPNDPIRVAYEKLL